MVDNNYGGLSYKTLFNENPRGMQRVFWACHPADHERCFPVISRDILECNAKTAIWYYDPRNPELSGKHNNGDVLANVYALSKIDKMKKKGESMR